MIDALDQDILTFVVFRLGEEEYAISIDRVESIIRYEEPTPVPRTLEIVQGVINMRGRVIPVVDLSKRFRGSPFVPSAYSRIVVAEGAAGTLGLAVDAANEVANIPVADVKPAPEGVLTPETAGAISGVVDRNGKLVILLELDEAIPKTEYVRADRGDVTAEEGEPDV